MSGYDSIIADPRFPEIRSTLVSSFTYVAALEPGKGSAVVDKSRPTVVIVMMVIVGRVRSLTDEEKMNAAIRLARWEVTVCSQTR